MIYLILYLFLELFFSFGIATELGFVFTFFEIILSAAIGFIILASFKYGAIDSLQKLKNGEIGEGEFVTKHILKLLGAILLILPGFLSDLVGILFQLGIFTFAASGFLAKYNNKPRESRSYDDLKNANDRRYEKRDDKRANSDIIDVEIIER